MAYTKGEKIKLAMFWCTIISIIFFFIEGVIAIVPVVQGAIIAMFTIGIIFAIIAGGLWLYVKVKRTNRKLTA